jgi:hypothetical protein
MTLRIRAREALLLFNICEGENERERERERERESERERPPQNYFYV